MPIVDITNVDEPVSVELGTSRYQDEDELYLRRLTVHATGRPGGLKSAGQPLAGQRSTLTDILDGWRRTQDLEVDRPDEVEEEEPTPALGEIRPHELLVKGFTLDERIAPGFRYRVRYIGNGGYLFDGEARRLQSIGLGYGRRLTFNSDKLNFNDCYFWTDSSPSGFAFTVVALRGGESFTIMDCDGKQLGTLEVQQAGFPQVETDTMVEESSRTVVKTVRVRFTCTVKHFHAHHALVNIDSPEIEMAEGVAELVKEKGSKEARVRCVKNVFLRSIGGCSLHDE